MPVYVISLQRDLKKRAHISQQLNSLGIPFEIVNAVDGKELDLSQIKERLKDDMLKYRGYELTRGEIGCYLSHYNLWQKIIAEKIPYALILEDDAILADDVGEIINALPNVDWCWDIVRLSATRKRKINRILQSIGKDRFLVRYRSPAEGTVAYIITLSGAKILQQHCQIINYPIDVLYEQWWKTGIQFFAIHPSPVDFLCDEPSDVWKEINNAPKISLSFPLRIKNYWHKKYNKYFCYLYNIFNPPKKRQERL